MAVIQRTILGVAPMRTSLLTLCAVLTVLFTVVEPAASAGLGWLARLLFWALHIGTALGGLLVVSLVIRQCGSSRWPLWLLVLISGVLGAMVAAPLFWGLELLFEPELTHLESESVWDRFGEQGYWQAIVAEFFEVLPLFMVSWVAMNLPLLFRRPTVYDPPIPPDDPNRSTPHTDDMEARRQALFESLPEVVGREIVAISSDLHYLNVYTVLGQAMVLGSLKSIAEAFGDQGVQVHRSHWVMKKQVVRVCLSGKEAFCLMSTGLRVPVSRSNRKLVKACFGQLRSATGVALKAVPQPSVRDTA